MAGTTIEKFIVFIGTLRFKHFCLFAAGVSMTLQAPLKRYFPWARINTNDSSPISLFTLQTRQLWRTLHKERNSTISHNNMWVNTQADSTLLLSANFYFGPSIGLWHASCCFRPLLPDYNHATNAFVSIVAKLLSCVNFNKNHCDWSRSDLAITWMAVHNQWIL